MGAKQHVTTGPVTCADDPVLILTSEHATLLGQLQVLEQRPLPVHQSRSILRTLIRDSALHFRREELLYRALSPKVGPGKSSLEPLTVEHRELKRKARQLLNATAAGVAKSKSRRNGRVRILCRELTKEFRAHIRHEETVVYVLARSRLGVDERKRLASRMLAV